MSTKTNVNKKQMATKNKWQPKTNVKHRNKCQPKTNVNKKQMSTKNKCLPKTNVNLKHLDILVFNDDNKVGRDNIYS